MTLYFLHRNIFWKQQSWNVQSYLLCLHCFKLSLIITCYLSSFLYSVVYLISFSMSFSFFWSIFPSIDLFSFFFYLSIFSISFNYPFSSFLSVYLKYSFYKFLFNLLYLIVHSITWCFPKKCSPRIICLKFFNKSRPHTFPIHITSGKEFINSKKNYASYFLFRKCVLYK